MPNDTDRDIYVVESAYTDDDYPKWQVFYAGRDFAEAQRIGSPRKDWAHRFTVWRDGRRVA